MILLVFLLILGLSTSSFGANETCVCNLNHPRLAIRECPEKFSNVVAFMDLSDKNDLIHGVRETASPFCEPHLGHIRTPPGWSAILRNGHVGFVQLDYGDKTVQCQRHLTHRQRSLGMPLQCNAIQTTIQTVAATTPNHLMSTTQPPPTTIQTTPVFHSPVQCLKFETITHAQRHEPVFHPLSRTCSGGEFETEAVFYKLCNNTHMSYWKKGIKVKDHCHDGKIPSFTAIASFFHDRPIDMGIFIGCNQKYEIEVFAQTCGTALKLKSVTGIDIDDYYTIVL